MREADQSGYHRVGSSQKLWMKDDFVLITDRENDYEKDKERIQAVEVKRILSLSLSFPKQIRSPRIIIMMSTDTHTVMDRHLRRFREVDSSRASENRTFHTHTHSP